jgi:hypothetical protein
VRATLEQERIASKSENRVAGPKLLLREYISYSIISSILWNRGPVAIAWLGLASSLFLRCIFSRNQIFRDWGYRNREHLEFEAGVLGRKVSDEFAVPLCRGHHRAVHRSGNEQAWCVCGPRSDVDSAREGLARPEKSDLTGD